MLKRLYYGDRVDCEDVVFVAQLGGTHADCLIFFIVVYFLLDKV